MENLRAVSYRLLCAADNSLSKIVSNHFGLDFNRVEHFSIVNADYRSNHLGDDNHVTEMGLDDSGFFVGRSLLLGFSEFLNETHWPAFETTLEPTTCTGRDELNKQSLDLLRPHPNRNYCTSNKLEGTFSSIIGCMGGELTSSVFKSRSFSRLTPR